MFWMYILACWVENLNNLPVNNEKPENNLSSLNYSFKKVNIPAELMKCITCNDAFFISYILFSN